MLLLLHSKRPKSYRLYAECTTQRLCISLLFPLFYYLMNCINGTKFAFIICSTKIVIFQILDSHHIVQVSECRWVSINVLNGYERFFFFLCLFCFLIKFEICFALGLHKTPRRRVGHAGPTYLFFNLITLSTLCIMEK